MKTLTRGAVEGISWDQLMENLIALAAKGSPEPRFNHDQAEEFAKRGQEFVSILMPTITE